MPTPEAAILAKAAALGAALPLFKQADAPELFASWADRIAWADSRRHSGKPHTDAVEEANRHIGRPTRRLTAPKPAPLALVLGLEPAAVA